VIAVQDIDAMEAAQLREVVRAMRAEVKHKDAVIEKLTHENAVLKRLKFAAQSERFNAEQRSLLEETLDADLQAVAEEIEQLTPVPAAPIDRQQAKRKPLPENLPRREVRHEPESTTCACGCQMKRIGEDVAEKLDYVPGVFTVERHIRGKWACAKCERLVQAPVAPHIIDKGIPTTGLLAQVLVAKYVDHLPLYRQEGIFERAGLAIPRSTLAQWVGSAGVQLRPLVDAMRDDLLRRRVLHADETPVGCSIPVPARPNVPICGVTAVPALSATGWWCSTSPRAEPAAMPWSSCGTLESKPGAARWSAMTTPATRRCSHRASPKLAAWRMRGASSTSCGPTTRARWPSRPWRCLAGCTTSNERWPICRPTSACAFGD
jgi:transposase